MDTFSLISGMSTVLTSFRIGWGTHDKGLRAKPFKEKQREEGAFETRVVGERNVPLDRIVGSVGRYHDFDDRFSLKQSVPREKLKAVRRAMKEGKPMPPVELYQIKNDYYVLDGNHRVSAARAFGYGDINARVVELIPSTNTFENVLYREKSEFADKTGLKQAIELTELRQYPYLLTQVATHLAFLRKQGDASISFQDAALDWYRTVYFPLTGIIERARLLEAFPDRTVADLYCYISLYQWEKGGKLKYGDGIDELVCHSMEEFRATISGKEESEYPDMLRQITAFVLMNVSARKEYRIIDKLFELKEVREIHAVHGDVDIIAKIVLTRDLVSSDAQIIGHFVHTHVRQLPGVVSTQTLIPGVSKIK